MNRSLPPGPKGRPVLGSLPDFWKDNLGFLLSLARQYGDVVHYRLWTYRVYQFNHPDDIQDVLVNHASKLQKAPLDKAIFSQSLGNGLLSSDGEFHRGQRKLMQPAFHSKRIESYAQIMTDFTAQMLAGWRNGHTLDIHEAMTHLTMLIVSKALYDVDVSQSADGVGEAIHTLNKLGEDQYKQGFVIPGWIPVSQNLRIKRAAQRLDEVMMPIIEQRRASGEDKGDLLSMLLLAQDEADGERMTDRQVRDEAVSLFVAGHETTSNLLSWAWYALAQHPEVEALLHSEIDRVLDGRTPTLHDLPKLPYTDMVIKEALRLYPPAWILNGRTPLEDIEVAGYTVPKGSLIFLSPYVLHRDPRYFPEPESFKPERWTDGLEKRIPRYAYFPFGGGPRVCIGNQFALMEARLVLATIAQHYKLTLQPDHPVIPDPLITLRPRHGIRMRVLERAAPAVPSPHDLLTAMPSA
jgi:cytochrome P450